MNPHQAHPTSPLAMFKSLWLNRHLISQMTRREVIGRYRGSIMGLAWSFFNPVLMLFVYTFVFSGVFKSRWGVGGEESKADFAIILFVGMIVHGLFAECLNRAPSLILSNVNYVKKVVFPLEILPWIAMGSALFHNLVSLVVLLLAQLLISHSLTWTSLLFPVVLVPLILASMGFAWLLAALGVYVRDIGQITGIFTAVLMFMSPVFYPVSALPEAYQSFLLLNPLTLIIEESRKVLIFGSMPDWPALGIAWLAGLVIAAGGFWWFQKTRRGFADVL
ncbi:ABC transporter permease [Heliophilum fasciatum]|uniref:Transport permease protein n=1 Tax=Heliophilum fasciatum TaxID=35700 RepID=A0A4R2RJM4_9FIRM|nr:ABC transporter permease [Heliophilum fasciatum]MCW2278997.1 lipopolysaccharide transport system permease protein [Heliophilum fasciatum]TCP64052.1 lipopolysaccharide transport system permease protein [Heliophilum fasciatum]